MVCLSLSFYASLIITWYEGWEGDERVTSNRPQGLQIEVLIVTRIFFLLFGKGHRLVLGFVTFEVDPVIFSEPLTLGTVPIPVVQIRSEFLVSYIIIWDRIWTAGIERPVRDEVLTSPYSPTLFVLCFVVGPGDKHSIL